MNRRILVVDDEANVRLNYRVTLETAGYIVLEANSGERALEFLLEQSFGLAILDMRMPGMDGLELLTRMRNGKITVPTLIITAYSDVPHAVKAMKLGAIDFIEKPLIPEVLRGMVREILQRHEAKEVKPAETFEAHILAAKRALNLRAFAMARLHLAKALDLNGKSSEAFNLAGVLSEMQQQYDKAKKYYGQAIRLNSNYAPAQQNMKRLFEVAHFGSSEEPFDLDGGKLPLP